MKDYFEFKNYDDAISLDAAIIRGVNYRITILSDILVRIEYNANGKFEDRPTELVKFRKFDVPVPPMDLQKQFGDFVHRVDKSKFDKHDNIFKRGKTHLKTATSRN